MPRRELPGHIPQDKERFLLFPFRKSCSNGSSFSLKKIPNLFQLTLPIMGNVVPQERVVDEAKRQDANNISQPRGSGATERIGFGQKLKRNIPFILIMFKWVVNCHSNQ